MDAPLIARVLAASRRLILAGVIPSEKALNLLIPDVPSSALKSARDRLRAEGRLSWSHLRRSYGPGLLGETRGERELIVRAICAERARKIEREHCPLNGRSELEMIAMKRVYRAPKT